MINWLNKSTIKLGEVTLHCLIIAEYNIHILKSTSIHAGGFHRLDFLKKVPPRTWGRRFPESEGKINLAGYFSSYTTAVNS